MSDNVETNVVEEANDKLDARVLARPTKNSGIMTEPEVIYMRATSPTSYDKSYKMVGKPPRRVKHVKLPISLDGQVFTKVDKLFDHLVNSGQYRVENVIS